MILKLICIPEHLINSIISAVAILLGAMLGGFFTWKISSANTKKSIEVQSKIAEENILSMKKNKENLICENASIIQLDICTALFQILRGLNCFNKDEYNIYPIPLCKDYAKVIISLKNEFDLKELSYLYQLYGIMEKLNKDFININGEQNEIIEDYNLFVKKLYGDNASKVLELDIDSISYKELYNNNIIKLGYKSVLDKLSYISSKAHEDK